MRRPTVSDSSASVRYATTVMNVDMHSKPTKMWTEKGTTEYMSSKSGTKSKLSRCYNFNARVSPMYREYQQITNSFKIGYSKRKLKN